MTTENNKEKISVNPIGKRKANKLKQEQAELFEMYEPVFKLIWCAFDGIIFSQHLQNYFNCKKEAYLNTIRKWEEAELIEFLKFGKNTLIKLKRTVSTLLKRGYKSTKVTNRIILRSALIGEIHSLVFKNDIAAFGDNFNLTNMNFNAKTNPHVVICSKLYKIYKEKGWDTENLKKHYMILKDRTDKDRLKKGQEDKKAGIKKDETQKKKLNIPVGHVDLWNLAMNNVFVHNFYLEGETIIINMNVLNFFNHTPQRIAKILDLTYRAISDMLYDKYYDTSGDNSRVHYKLNITVYDLYHKFHNIEVGYYNNYGGFEKSEKIPYENGYFDDYASFINKEGIVKTCNNKIGYYNEYGKFIEGKKPYADFYYDSQGTKIKHLTYNNKPHWDQKGFNTRGNFLIDREGKTYIKNTQYDFKDKNGNILMPDGTVAVDTILKKIEQHLIKISKVYNKFTYNFICFDSQERLLSNRKIENLV